MTSREFAIQAHGEQRYGDDPCVSHLDEVAAVLREFSHNRQALIDAAYLHDVLEDTDAPPGIVGAKFPASYRIVYAVTDGPGSNRKERHASTYPKITRCGTDAVLVKLADRIANVRRSLRSGDHRLSMYRREYRDFRAALRVVPGADPMWECLDKLMRRTDHGFVQHQTYTGPGCAVCGMQPSFHGIQSTGPQIGGGK